MLPAVTGVITSNNFLEWIIDMENNSIDIMFEEHLKECKEEYHDACYESDSEDARLVGFKLVDGMYEPDYNEEYIMIISWPYTQILKSPYAVESSWCSPCFPHQGNVESYANGVWSYCPPLEEDEHGIYENRKVHTVADWSEKNEDTV